MMGSLDGDSFWVGCGWIFLGKLGWGRENTRASTSESCSLESGDSCFRTVPFFKLHIIYWAVGVSLNHVSDHRERCPRSSMSWEDTFTVVYVTCYFCHMLFNVYFRIYITLIRTGTGGGI